MKLSNLRIERRNGMSCLTCDMDAQFTDVNQIWFSVPTEHEKYLTDDVYDAFMVAAIYPAMFYNENVEIEGKVSRRLYFNITRYVPSVVKAYRPEMYQVEFNVKGFASAKQEEKGVGTGFSAGVDSFSTVVDHFANEDMPEYKISSLFLFNVGSHGGGGDGARQKFQARYELLKGFPKEVGLPYIPLDSNLFDFYLKHWEFDAGVFCRACAILVLQKCIAKYFLSSDYSYQENMFTAFNPHITSLSEMAELFLNPMLSTECVEIITDGAQYLRTQKTEAIAKYEPTPRYLNVCVDHHNHDTAENCGVCHKCLRTLIAIESLGLLDKFNKVFDLSKYRGKAYRYKCQLRLDRNTSLYARDNVDFAIAHGNRIPSYAEAWLYMSPYKVRCLAGQIKRKLIKTIENLNNIWNINKIVNVNKLSENGGG